MASSLATLTFGVEAFFVTLDGLVVLLRLGDLFLFVLMLDANDGRDGRGIESWRRSN